VVALHNLEEALTMPAWMDRELPALLARTGWPATPPSRSDLYAGLVMVTIVPAVILAAASREAAGRWTLRAGLLIAGIFFWNAFVPHLTSALYLRGYTPGVLTAGLLTLPWAVAVFRHAIQAGRVTTAEAAAVLAVAAVVYPLGMFALWRVP
jgi:hypothetical protein